MTPFSNLTAQVAPMTEVSRVAQQEQEHAQMRQQSLQVAAQNGKEQQEVQAVERREPGQKVRREQNRQRGGGEQGGQRDPARKKAEPAESDLDLDVPSASELWSGNILDIKI